MTSPSPITLREFRRTMERHATRTDLTGLETRLKRWLVLTMLTAASAAVAAQRAME